MWEWQHGEGGEHHVDGVKGCLRPWGMRVLSVGLSRLLEPFSIDQGFYDLLHLMVELKVLEILRVLFCPH